MQNPLKEWSGRLRKTWTMSGDGEFFDALAPHLNGEAGRGDYVSIASKVGKSEGAVRTAASRLRKDYRDLLLKEIRRTMDEPSQVEDELRALFEVFSAWHVAALLWREWPDADFRKLDECDTLEQVARRTSPAAAGPRVAA